MQPRKIFAIVFAFAFLLAPMAAWSQVMILETEPDTTSLSYCDMKHSVLTCNYVHVETSTALAVGVPLQLDGQSYVLDAMGPGYYLESGMILQPWGETRSGLNGQRWLEIRPHEGRVHTSRSWRDTDGNGVLSPSDKLGLDADRELAVKDVRLHLRVRPAAASGHP